MRRTGAVPAALCAVVAFGCGKPTVESVGRRIGGVWAVESHTTNAAGCDAEGPSTLDAVRERHFVAVATKTLGESRLTLASCVDVGACRDKERRLAAGEMLSGEWFYEFTTVAEGGRLAARYASTGFASEDRKTCSGGSASERTLEVRDGKLRIEERTRTARDYPADAEGGCWTDRALAAAEGQPCSRLQVLIATAVR